MGGTSELCCVVKSNISDDVVLKGEPNEWATLRWTDEFGNSIAPFFTSLESGQPFLKEMNGWQLKRYPVSFVVEVHISRHQARDLVLHDRPSEHREVQGAEPSTVSYGVNLSKASGGH